MKDFLFKIKLYIKGYRGWKFRDLLQEFRKKNCKHKKTKHYFREYNFCKRCNIILKLNNIPITHDEARKLHYLKEYGKIVD